MSIMRANPAQSADENVVPSQIADTSMAPSGSNAPNSPPVTEPTIDTPCKYMPKATNVPMQPTPTKQRRPSDDVEIGP